jgi:pyruvate formate lyase activating enzyme
MDIVPISTLDWPGKVCMTIFFKGCTYKCWYCSNWKNGTPQAVEAVKEKITAGKDYVDAVVFSGGEPLAQLDALRSLCEHAKSLGLKVGLNTSGRYPDRLQAILDSVDAVMLDYKAPLGALKNIVGWRHAPTSLKECLHIMKTRKDKDKRPLYYEVRTTVFRLLNDTEEDIEGIATMCDGADAYALQQGRPELAMLERHHSLPTVTVERLRELGRAAKPHVRTVIIRTPYDHETI